MTTNGKNTVTIETFGAILKEYLDGHNTYQKEKMLAEIISHPALVLQLTDELSVEMLKMYEYRPDDSKMVVISEFSIATESEDMPIGVIGIKSHIKNINTNNAKYIAPELLGVRAFDDGSDMIRVMVAMKFYEKFGSNNLLNCAATLRDDNGNVIKEAASLNDIFNLSARYEYKL